MSGQKCMVQPMFSRAGLVCKDRHTVCLQGAFVVSYLLAKLHLQILGEMVLLEIYYTV
jgi:hypothetical protein